MTYNPKNIVDNIIVTKKVFFITIVKVLHFCT